MKKISMLLTIIFISAVLSHCGTRDDDRETAGQSNTMNLSPAEQLTGEWSGIYRSFEGGKPYGDASEATLKLKAEGSFDLGLSDSESARVVGQWSEFQGRSLILKISGSTLPRVGIAGKLIEPTYELQGLSLRISGDGFELKLSKRGDNSGSLPGGGAQSPGALGSWTCIENNGRETNLKLMTDNSFSLVSKKPSERIFVATGRISKGSGTQIILVPLNASDPLPINSFFELSTESSQTRLKLVSSDGGLVTLLGVCTQST